MTFTVEYELEEDGRWLAEVKELPGVMVYGKNPDDAMAHAQALALRVVADVVFAFHDNNEIISRESQKRRQPASIFSRLVTQEDNRGATFYGVSHSAW